MRTVLPMARLPRVDPKGPLHHTMNRGARKQPIFLDDTDRRVFLSLLSVIHERFGVEIQAYALMGDHYHLMLYCPQGNLSQAMQYLSSVYTQRFNRRHGFDGALFRGRFRSIPVTRDEYLLELTRYIHRNPKDVGFAGRLADYRWSSYAMYLGRRPKPRWLGRPLALALIGKNADRYRMYVETHRPYDSWQPPNTNPLEIRAVLRAVPSRSSIVPGSHQLHSLDGVEAAVMSVTGTTLDRLLTDEPNNRIREAALLLATECTAASIGEIAAWSRASSEEAVVQTLQWARARTNEASFAALLSRSREQLRQSEARDTAS